MNRRTYIKTFLAASGGLAVLPSWALEWTPDQLLSIGNRASFSELEAATLSSVVDTIIPAGNSIGARAVGVDIFLQKLFENCYEQPVQDNVKEQLRVLDGAATRTHAQVFSQCDPLQRQELLLKLSVSMDQGEKDFYELVKGETIRGFRTSREVMMNYLNYQVIPGHFHGCVDINS